MLQFNWWQERGGVVLGGGSFVSPAGRLPVPHGAADAGTAAASPAWRQLSSAPAQQGLQYLMS